MMRNRTSGAEQENPMIPAYIVTGGVVLFAVVMTALSYVIVRRERRGAAKSPPHFLSRT